MVSSGRYIARNLNISQRKKSAVELWTALKGWYVLFLIGPPYVCNIDSHSELFFHK